MLSRLPRVVKLLGEYGAAAMESKVVNGKYMYPMISPRKAAMHRKRSIIEGSYGEFVKEKGGWDPSWDKVNKIVMARPYKLHKRTRTRPERAAKITKALEDMPAREAKYYKEAADRRPVKGIIYHIERIEMMWKKDLQMHHVFDSRSKSKGKGGAAGGKKAQTKKPKKK